MSSGPSTTSLVTAFLDLHPLPLHLQPRRLSQHQNLRQRRSKSPQLPHQQLSRSLSSQLSLSLQRRNQSHQLL
jgi:hypothetical protein